MNDYSIVYLGPFDRAPFFGGAFWFDKDVPQTVRGDLAAQLLYTKTTDGGQQFQLATQADFEGMLADGFIAAGTSPDGLVWGGGARGIEPAAALMADVTVSSDSATAADDGSTDSTNAADDETADGTDDTPAGDSTPATPKATGRRARNGSNASNTGAQA